MAYVALLDSKTGRRKGMKITHQQAVDILDVLEGRKEPEDEKQAAFAERVHRVYFSWREADPLYIMGHIDQIVPFALAEWAVDTRGVPARPDNGHSWDFARRYQLWANKAPANQAKHYIEKLQLTKRGFK
jgi:hypothetical protein